MTISRCQSCRVLGYYSNDICNECHRRLRQLDMKMGEVMEEEVDTGTKYMRTIRERKTGKTIQVDTYDVAVAFGLICPARVHALKKTLCAGTRGTKDERTDINEAMNSLKISKELILEKKATSHETTK